MLDVSIPYACKVIRKLNTKFKDQNCITIEGRIDRKFFMEQFYGTRSEKEGRDGLRCRFTIDSEKEIISWQL